MCGINGLIQFQKEKRRYDREEMRRIVHAMNERILHRGPDHEGIFADEYCAIGMRRLSIIDLSSGNQPIWNENRTMMIVFNGEIYNFRQLRERLAARGHQFSTSSDTEVILHGYEEYGLDILDDLEGMFSFCIYDTLLQRWILARDRIGEKPLYYYHGDDIFLFGSELKSLSHTGFVPKEIDLEALSIYFRLTYIPAPRTIFRKVKKLPPATAMIIEKDGQVQVRRYWNLPKIISANEPIKDYEECKRRLREALFLSVEKRMESEVPVGAFLSGGFDSTIITGIMSQISNDPVLTFTIGFNEKAYDESELAKKASKLHHTEHHIFTLDWNAVMGNLNGLLANMDEPFADSSLIATYAVSAMAKQYATVVLTGDAGDELFAGYNKYLGDYYSAYYRKIPKILRGGWPRQLRAIFLPAPNFRERCRK